MEKKRKGSAARHCSLVSSYGGFLLLRVSQKSMLCHVFSKAKSPLVHVNATRDHSGSNEEAANAWIRCAWSWKDKVTSYLHHGEGFPAAVQRGPSLSTGSKHITRRSHHPCAAVPAIRRPHVLLTKHVLSFKQVSFKAFRRDTASSAKAN